MNTQAFTSSKGIPAVGKSNLTPEPYVFSYQGGGVQRGCRVSDNGVP